MPSDPQQDREDLRALQAGEEAALDRLMLRWQQPLLNFAYRYLQNAADAQDIVAGVFVAFYRECGRLASDTVVPAWLFTVAANRCRNQVRWRHRHPAESWESAAVHAAPAPEPEPDLALLQAEAQRRLRSAVEQLPHDLKVAILLHHYEGLSYREIAVVAGCGERGVESRLYRARTLLRQALG
jgi:RNA polymerase sigma-70 factor (ECF subfamily)